MLHNSITHKSISFLISADASKKQEEDTLGWDDALPSGKFIAIIIIIYDFLHIMHHFRAIFLSF
jgi:hypothetical protein